MKITSVNRAIANKLMNRVEELLKPLESEYGVKVNFNGGSFDVSYYKPKISINVINESGIVETNERRNYLDLCDLYNLKKEYLDKEFSFGGRRYILTGLKPRKKKFPVLARHIVDNALFCFKPDAINVAFRGN
jgi:hypothetical protein